MNHLVIIGNLTADPQTRTTQTGKQVCSFTVAVNRPQTANAGQQEADFFRVSAWGKLGENCSKWLIKGKKVAVTGRVSVSTYTTQKGETRAQMDVMAESVEFLSPANTTEQDRPPVHNTPPIPQTDRQSGFVQVDEDELPF